MTVAEAEAEAFAFYRDLIISELSGEGRDFLVRNNGDQVKVSDLVGKKVIGLYFSASWSGPCHRFTPKLVEAYNELSLKNAEFEVVFISSDEDEESFRNSFSVMPWLAIPFSESATRHRLNEQYNVEWIPYLTIFDEDLGFNHEGAQAVIEYNARAVKEYHVQAVIEFGSEAFPFTIERIINLKADAGATKKNQTIQSVLISSSRDFLISSSRDFLTSNNGNKVPVAELEGKIVGLYFSGLYTSCHEFTPMLVKMYKKLKDIGENFEIVLISLETDESSFQLGFAGMPWLAFPFKDKSCLALIRYFELETLPTLVVIGADGKILIPNAVEMVEDHGVEAYPFSPEKLEEFAEKEKARIESQTLESLLVSGDRDYVIGKGGIKVSISELIGKNVLLYFLPHWCDPCRAFLRKLKDTYNAIKSEDPFFELIFISSDDHQSNFDYYFSSMPWLAIPFGDERIYSLTRTFKVYGKKSYGGFFLEGNLSLVAIGPTGKTITKDARDMIMWHGADAYPFTEERIKELKEAEEEATKKLKHRLHEERCDLEESGNCNMCDEKGYWSVYCDECDVLSWCGAHSVVRTSWSGAGPVVESEKKCLCNGYED